MIDCGCDEILLPQGSDGVDGKNAFTVTTVQFTQPNAGDPVTITVSDTLQNTNQWAIPGQIIRITDASSNGGWYRVTSIVGTNQIIAVNLDYQPGSSISPTPILVGAKVSPAGLQGPAGSPGSTGGVGDTGPANQLSIGTVSTVTPGNPATATITGDAPNQTLNLGIPSGLPGTSGGTLHHSFISSPSITLTPSTFGGTLFDLQTFRSDTLCPTDGSAARIRGSFAAFGSGIKDAARAINDISFYIGNNGTPASIVPRVSVTPSNDEDKRPKILNVIGAGDNCHFKFEIIVQRINATNSIITVDWTWSGQDGDNRNRVYIGNSIVTGSLNFNTNSLADFIIKYDTPAFTQVLNVIHRNLTVEKITL
jgi:hypothetical protein